MSFNYLRKILTRQHREKKPNVNRGATPPGHGNRAAQRPPSRRYRSKKKTKRPTSSHHLSPAAILTSPRKTPSIDKDRLAAFLRNKTLTLRQLLNTIIYLDRHNHDDLIVSQTEKHYKQHPRLFSLRSRYIITAYIKQNQTDRLKALMRESLANGAHYSLTRFHRDFKPVKQTKNRAEYLRLFLDAYLKRGRFVAADFDRYRRTYREHRKVLLKLYALCSRYQIGYDKNEGPPAPPPKPPLLSFLDTLNHDETQSLLEILKELHTRVHRKKKQTDVIPHDKYRVTQFYLNPERYPHSLLALFPERSKPYRPRSRHNSSFSSFIFFTLLHHYSQLNSPVRLMSLRDRTDIYWRDRDVSTYFFLLSQRYGQSSLRAFLARHTGAVAEYYRRYRHSSHVARYRRTAKSLAIRQLVHFVESAPDISPWAVKIVFQHFLRVLPETNNRMIYYQSPQRYAHYYRHFQHKIEPKDILALTLSSENLTAHLMSCRYFLRRRNMEAAWSCFRPLSRHPIYRFLFNDIYAQLNRHDQPDRLRRSGFLHDQVSYLLYVEGQNGPARAARYLQEIFTTPLFVLRGDRKRPLSGYLIEQLPSLPPVEIIELVRRFFSGSDAAHRYPPLFRELALNHTGTRQGEWYYSLYLIFRLQKPDTIIDDINRIFRSPHSAAVKLSLQYYREKYNIPADRPPD